MSTRFRIPPARILPALLALLTALFLGAAPAQALPPGGASGNTPGTSSSVNPGSVRAGDYLNFRLSGFPAGSTVSVKFDDGSTCPSDAPQGACVVHQQVVPSSGTVSGSFQVPKDIKKGTHTLRFLTAVYVDAQDHDKGSKGYSNRSPQFRVTGVNQQAGSSGSVSGQQVKPRTAEGNGGSGSGNSNGGSGSAKNGSGNGSGSGNSNSGTSNGDGGSKDSAAGSSGSKNDPGSRSGSGGKKTQYVDENGNPLSEEEAKKLQDEGKGGSVKEEVVEEDDPSAAPSASASSAPSASASSTTEHGAQADDASESKDSGADIPWIGILAVVLVALVAAVVLIRRALARRADRSTGTK